MVRIDDSGNVPKCWLNREELSTLEAAAGDGWGWEREVAIQLMGRCGLRASEVSYPGPAELRWSDDGECWLFEVRGKNTKGGDKKTRDAWMPESVQENIHRYARERGIEAGTPWVDAGTSTIRRWVKDAAERVGGERWEHVSSHDLRRSFATYHLVERQVDVRTMMAIGGWNDYTAIEPYLNEPTERRIGEALGTATAPTIE